MADTLVTLRPNGTAAAGTWIASGGAPSLHAATNDDSDTTYAAEDINDLLVLDMGTTVVPALAQLKSVTARYRVRSDPAILSSITRTMRVLVGGVGRSDTFTIGTAISTLTGTTWPSQPNGTPWDQAALDALQAEIGFGSGTLDVYEVYFDVRYNQAPTATPTSPSGTVTTARPTLAWTYSDPEGDAQERRRAKVFTAQQFGLGSFDPATSTALWDSSLVFGETSSATSITNGPQLVNGVYRLYVQVADAGSGGRYGPWAYVEFTVAADPAATPSIAATADGDGRVLLTIMGAGNLLDADQASMETTIVDKWAAGLHSVLTRSNTQSLNGSWSLSDAAGTGIAGADMTFRSMGALGAGATQVPYVAGVAQPLTGLAYLRADSTGRTLHLSLEWRDAAFAVLSTTAGHNVVDVTTGWTLATVGPAAAPPGAVFCSLLVTIQGAVDGEVHYVDEAAIVPYAPNLLARDAASLELSAAWWSSATGGTFARLPMPPVPALQGTAVGSTTSTGAGNADSVIPNTSAGAPVIEGETYSACVAFRTADAPRSCRCILTMLDAANANVTETVGAAVTATADGWTFAVVEGMVAPAGALKARIRARFAASAAGQRVYFDCAGVMPGTSATYRHPPAWTPGGLVAAETVSVERSADQGATWEPVRLGAGADFDLTLIEPGQYRMGDTAWDSLAPRGVELLYRAQVSSGIAISDTSPYAAVTPEVTDDEWLRNPLDPSMDMRICLEAPLESDSTETQAVGEPVGGTTYRVARGDVRGEVLGLSLSFETDAEWHAFEALRRAQTTLLLQTRYGDGTGALEQFYVALGPTRSVTRIEKGGGGQLRLVRIAAREVAAPTVP